MALVSLCIRKLKACEAIRDREDLRITTIRGSRIPSRVSGNATTLVVTLIIIMKDKRGAPEPSEVYRSLENGFSFWYFFFSRTWKKEKVRSLPDNRQIIQAFIPKNLKAGSEIMTEKASGTITQKDFPTVFFLDTFSFGGKRKSLL